MKNKLLYFLSDSAKQKFPMSSEARQEIGGGNNMIIRLIIRFLFLPGIFLWLCGINAYAIEINEEKDNLANERLRQIIYFVINQGEELIGRNYSFLKNNHQKLVGLGWEQEHPEWKDTVRFHFLTRLIEIEKFLNDENETDKFRISFHRMWLPPQKKFISEDPKFFGFQPENDFFERLTVQITKSDLSGYTCRDSTCEYDKPSEVNFLTEKIIQKELKEEISWWINYINKRKARTN